MSIEKYAELPLHERIGDSYFRDEEEFKIVQDAVVEAKTLVSNYEGLQELLSHGTVYTFDNDELMEECFHQASLKGGMFELIYEILVTN